MSLSLSHHLFPVSSFSTAFTTYCFNLGPRGIDSAACPTLHVPGVDSVALRDADVGTTPRRGRATGSGLSPPDLSEVDWPAPSLAWEAFYPNGSINPAAAIPGGFGFYVAGPAAFSEKLAAGATHAVLSYRMMLQEGWEWVKGGKLPGIYGGEGDSSYACTGGRQEARSKCFNVRPMWRPKGQGELYTYLPLTDRNQQQLSAVPPYSTGNAQYGFSVGRNAFNFDVGRWITLAFRVKLNDVGSENGELELWVDGESVISVSGLTLRDSDKSRIKGAHFQTFFGGHEVDWASPKDQRAWFADLSGAIIE
ncbi:polysaccharide lyase family 14 protein [Roridomyces roridus]|uniref:Polysaccharide lyase family 14 protein n=1 Tax=Roridomyces roridus TaxID=1738132 RepID=A0AAD7CA64_9AGAR|nr:polysaccharide lyase family 14 protein [Roridomyces roridus]